MYYLLFTSVFLSTQPFFVDRLLVFCLDSLGQALAVFCDNDSLYSDFGGIPF
jgi:hypothetical protein